MPNNRYTDPLAYTITNNPGSHYTMPSIDYTAGFDRISGIVRAASAAMPHSVSLAATAGNRSPAVSTARGWLTRSAAKLAGMALLAGLAVLITSDKGPQK
jgi:hypothetical protein